MSDKINFLVDQIRKHRAEYTEGVPTLSDAAFDALIDELKGLDPKNIVLTEVGAPPTTGYRTAKHKIPMGSLNNVFTKEEMILHLTKKMSSDSYVLQWKLDGLSFDAEYEDGKLRSGLTRGDGKEGVVITYALSKMKNVRTQLPISFTGSLRGEGIILKSDFEKLSLRMESQGLSRFANTRNAAAGIAKRKDAVDAEFITVIWFDVSNGKKFETEMAKIEFIQDELKLMPVETIQVQRINQNDRILDEIQYIYQKYSNDLAQKDFDADGMVIKIDDVSKQEDLGFEELDPKWALAYKFPQEEKKVVIKKINWQVGSSGRITPVAVIDPTQMSGVTVTNLSLHNYQMLVDKGFTVGATVMASRHGGVIPQVDELIIPGTGDTMAPKNCPLCGQETKKDGAFLVCSNESCPAKLESVFTSWIGINGWAQLGISSVKKLLETGKIKEPTDFYKLTIRDMIECEIGEANGQKILNEITGSKSLTIPQVLAGMAFDQVSEGRFERMMAGGLDTMDKILEAPASKISTCPGLGEAAAKNFLKGLELRKPWIKNVLAFVKIKDTKQVTNGKLSGIGVQFTGKLSKGRDEMENMAQEKGAKIGWKKGLRNILVMNPGGREGSKAQDAKKNGYEIMDESSWMLML